MATHSNILAWRIPWTEEPDGLYRVAKSQTGLSTHACTRPTTWRAQPWPCHDLALGCTPTHTTAPACTPAPILGTQPQVVEEVPG